MEEGITRKKNQCKHLWGNKEIKKNRGRYRNKMKKKMEEQVAQTGRKMNG